MSRSSAASSTPASSAPPESYDAAVPSIAGRSWITSFNQLVLDPTDPFQEGFVVGQPWEPEY